MQIKNIFRKMKTKQNHHQSTCTTKIGKGFDLGQRRHSGGMKSTRNGK